MSQDLSSLVPILVESESVPFLRRRGGLVSNVFTVREQAVTSRGGQSVRVTMPNAPTTPVDVSYTASNATQDINLPSATLTFSNHKQRKISLSELESRTAQGNQVRILKETMTGMMDDLLFIVEQDIGSLWSYLPIEGANNKRLSDATMRAALARLQAARVDPERDQVVFRGTVKQYTRDLLDIDRYVLAINQGEGLQGSSQAVVSSGTIPTLYNMNAAWTQAMPSQTFSGTGTEIGMMFEKHSFAIGFLQFQPSSVISQGSAAVTESFTIDPESGITIRWQTYMDMDKREVYLQADVCWGSVLLDATRGITILSATA